MKMNRRKLEPGVRIYLRNCHKFFSSLVTDEKFFGGWLFLHDKWNPIYGTDLKSGPPIDAHVGVSLAQINAKTKHTEKRTKLFLSELGERRAEFLSDVSFFIRNNSLGNEWERPILDFIVTGVMNPPKNNLNIRINETTPKGVILEINPDTTIADMQAAWPEIESAQKITWPNVKKQNFTFTKFENLIVATKDIVERLKVKASPQTDSRKSNKRRDEDLVATIWPDVEDTSLIADKKRAAKLRQIRKRMRKSP